MKFTEFGFGSDLQEGVDSLGFEKATPIQEKAIPAIMDGNDVFATAQTGTGKTAAFLLPIIDNICKAEDSGKTKALIIVPTRELAIQIDQQMEGFSYFTSISSMAAYGGRDGVSFGSEKQAFEEGADVVICTPGKLIAHLNLGYIDFSGLKYLVLDEADRMLDMGFIDDILKIISFLPKEKQTLLFSATMPKKIQELALKVLNNPAKINIAISKPAENALQLAYVIYEEQKKEVTKYILSSQNLKSVIVFCSTKLSANNLYKSLKGSEYSVNTIHSDLEQSVREQVILDFKNREFTILVATDIVSRGIDIEYIDMVVNYDVPNDAEDYIHRIGRTARAEADGVAITLIGKEDQGKFAKIESLLGSPVHKAALPPSFGEVPEYNPPAKGKSKGKRRYYKKKKK